MSRNRQEVIFSYQEMLMSASGRTHATRVACNYSILLAIVAVVAVVFAAGPACVAANDSPSGESQPSSKNIRQTTNSVGMQLALVPAGRFDMGSPDEEAGRYPYERPQHRVQISQPFYLGIHEVTQAEWESIMGTNPSSFAPTGDSKEKIADLNTRKFPVEQISWYDAIYFCNQLSRKEKLPAYYELKNIFRKKERIASGTVTVLGGLGYRLPTEAEWELACRAGTTTTFCFGAQLNEKHANVDGEFPYGASSDIPPLGRTTTVGSYQPNAFGLYDMHGNVSEWCFDWFHNKIYAKRTGITVDPVVSILDADVTTPKELKVHRGGDFWLDADAARSAFRNGNTPGFYLDNIGVRLARSVE
jgi:formylglycine-generating enzyme required for sulfatase activity